MKDLIDIKKLAEIEFPFSENRERRNEFHQIVKQEVFVKGFNKAIELIKEKLYTHDDMLEAIVLAREGNIINVAGIDTYFEFEYTEDNILNRLKI